MVRSEGDDGRPPALTVPVEPASLNDAQLLSLLLGPNSLAGICAEIRAIHDLRAIARLRPAELKQFGLNRRQAERILAVCEFAKRYGEERFEPGQSFRGSYDVYAHFRERLAEETVEHFIVVLLDNKNRKLKEVLISKGSLTSSIVHPRDVYMPVIRESAAAVVYVHNHPSGDATPSKEDLEITRRLREVGELVGVRVLDHIVIGKGRYVSFVDDGYW